ncbi:MAG: ATP-binding protein [Bacteroidales bacterium]|nr:ATP-binding protein [Bacteroidales bacterium]
MVQKSLIFKRKAYERMLKWKNERKGETALLLQGARRIGKSTLAESFAEREYKSYLLVDFSVAPTEVFDLFEDISDLNYVFFRLQLIYHKQLFERESVVIFDEVQQCPKARQAIKHLVRDHRYDYIETGSLISVRKKSVDIVIPSEETKVDMYPMDYEEFKWAIGDAVTVPLLREAFVKRTPLGDKVHQRMMRDFRLYMIIGGMPQAVAKYIETNNLSEVDLVKRDIIALYEEDFNKIDDSGRATAMFDAIPSLLSKNYARYPVSQAIKGEKIERVSSLVKAMEDAMSVNVAYQSNDPNVGLALTRDNERFKLYVADTGLFITLAFKDKEFVENDLYNKLLNNKLSTNLGYIYENMIAQMLRATGKSLFYHIMPIDDGKKYYEVDFLVVDGHKISPIEVKSSGYKTHASLDEFCRKYSDRIQNKYLVYTKDLQHIGDVNYLPVYMTMFL